MVYVQHTPDICNFLGLSASDSIPSTKLINTKSGNDNSTKASADTGEHPAEKTGSIGAILAGILSVTFFVAVIGVLAFSPERRNSIKSLFRRSTSAVRMNEEANLLLEPNGEFTDSDDDMLL
ncbi:uncharacterized protein LOC119686367 isoform X2 [Teleopsis dalmanni]|uniref:uncharacterized protein LOC119686367 isoform X2 n=1 Tax=Teleopsis dalmanni TaxID=139649 RepID=UPI0018CDFE58|nr:uncharacterized protein LOC119686367 isoform X2 [Teleopsis dalmanni]